MKKDEIGKNIETVKRIARKYRSGIVTTSATSAVFDKSIDDIKRELEQPARAAKARHAPDEHVKNFVLDAYCRGQWKSKLQAARVITPRARAEAKKIGAICLKTDNAQKTVYDWILKGT